MKPKVCMITGANSGIGKQAAVQLAKAGHRVVMACRSRERGEQALQEVQALSGSGNVALMQADLSLLASVKNFADEVLETVGAVDVLIHNAAVFDIAQKHAVLTAEGHESVWMTNHIGPVYLTSLLLEALKKSENGRVITVASKGLLAMPGLRVDLEDPEFKHRKFSMAKAYYQSKLAQIMFTYDLAEKLKDTNVTVNCIRVPAVKIDISRHPELSAFTQWVYRQKSKRSIAPEDMARTYVYLATSEDVRRITGKYFDENNRQVKSGPYTRDPEAISAVMELTDRYLR